MENLGYLLMKAAKELKYELNKNLEFHNFTASQFAVIKNLELAEKNNLPVNQRTAAMIAINLDFDKPTISGIVQRLVEKEMLEKKKHPTDKRAFILALTDVAYQKIPYLEEASLAVINKAFINFTQEEKQQFFMLLIKFNEGLNSEV